MRTSTRTSTLALAIALATTGTGTGCVALGLGGSPSGSGSTLDGTPGGGSYDGLVASQEARRTRFGGEEIGEMYPAGDTIYWLEYRDWDPTLHGLDTATGASADDGVDYATPLRFDTLNVRVDPDAVAYAEPVGGSVTYHVYAAGKPNQEITTVTVPAPTDEQRWWAYALDGTDLYLVVTGAPDTELYRVPSGGSPELVTTLESAGCDVAEFWDFGVDGDTMVFIESGRIWTLDLAANRAEWLGNDKQVQGTVDFADDGILFTAYDGSLDVPWFFDTSTGELTNVAEQIAAQTFTVPESTDSAFWYYQDIARWRDWFVYGGNTGIFAFQPSTGAIVPVLLEPRTADLRVVYRYPVVTENGHLYVTGLESTSGSVGADGPIWEVDLASLLE